MLFCIFLLLYKEGTVSDTVDTVIEKEVCVMLFWVLFHHCCVCFLNLFYSFSIISSVLFFVLFLFIK